MDDIAICKSLHTEAINHDPAITFLQTGAQQPGRPSLGAWLSYGLGSANDDLPCFVVMISQGSGNKTDQPIFSRLWGSGFLPSEHQGVRFRSQGDPVLYLSNPPGVDAGRAPRDAGRRERAEPDRRRVSSAIRRSTRASPSTRWRSACRPRCPGLTDLSDEPQRILDLYGINDSGVDGGYARNCLLARRMAERGVRFIQLIHRGWDQHGDLPRQIRGQCQDVDQPTAALVKDLKQRGLLDDTLVIWGGEFGRTVYSQGALTKDNYGRDHHGRCFTMWVAGGGIQARHHLRRDRRLLLQHRPGPGPRPRLERHDPALPGHRAHAADVPLPRPRLPPDRRPRQRGPGIAHVTGQDRSPAPAA